jgi:hypothetical protein
MDNRSNKQEDIEWCCEHLCWDDLNDDINDMCFSECLELPNPCAEYDEYKLEQLEEEYEEEELECEEDPIACGTG